MKEVKNLVDVTSWSCNLTDLIIFNQKLDYNTLIIYFLIKITLF